MKRQREYRENNIEKCRKKYREYYRKYRLDRKLPEEKIAELKEKATALLEKTFK